MRFSLSAVVLILGLACAAHAADNSRAPGLVGEYFLVKGISDFPNITGKQPFFVRIDKSIDFPEHGSGFQKARVAEDFYVRWTGFLNAPADGQYAFTGAVDDGLRVTIDGKVILSDFTKNGVLKITGKADLTAGEHPIVVEYVQKGGGASVVLDWQTPSGKSELIPPAAFSHDKSAEAIAWDEKAWKKARTVNVNASQWESLDYGPFLSASIRAEYPSDNLTYKGVAVKLPIGEGHEGLEAAVCFDTQLMRVSAGWTGGFLHLVNVAFTGDHGPCPSVDGDQVFGTHNMPGWAQKDGSFTDPRLALYGEGFGGMPRDYLHYKGLYRHGQQVIFSYSVNDMDVLEMSGAKSIDGETYFTRSLQLHPSPIPQTVLLAEVRDYVKPEHVGNAANTLTWKDTNSFVLGVNGLPAGADLKCAQVAEGKFKQIVLTLAPHTAMQAIQVVLGKVADDKVATINDAARGEIPDLAALTHGGPAHWSQELPGLKSKLAAEPTKEADKAAYVLDEIGLPEIPSNWPRLRFGGFDFFPDGHTAALCTWNGDVYIARGIDDTLEHVTWRRIAGGMFQTLGLKIVDGNIYVHGRDQITILHDLDGDGEADFYENFNNDVAMTDHFHEFAFDLQQDAAGNFYIIKGGGVNPGGGGFQRPITRNHGTLMKISRDGSKLEVLANGFRAPNGMCVRDDGQAVTGDNQGTWTPVDRLNWVHPGMFCGVVDLAHQATPPTVTENPLCWFIYPGWDNSCGDPVFVTSDKWGQPKGELFYLSYGQTSLLHILHEEVDGQIQGGAVRFPWHFASGAMRARFNPGDGQLYVCGFQGWQTNAHRGAAFERVRYTGAKCYMPTALHVRDNGVEISFPQPLKKDSVEDAGAWSIEQWNYKWTGSYGSPEVKVSDPKQRGHDALDVKSVKLSDDGKTVFLEVPNLQPVMQMLIRANALEAADGTPVNVEVANTINAVKGKKLVVEVGKVEVK